MRSATLGSHCRCLATPARRPAQGARLQAGPALRRTRAAATSDAEAAPSARREVACSDLANLVETINNQQAQQGLTAAGPATPPSSGQGAPPPAQVN
jgi:hypothetical protein